MNKKIYPLFFIALCWFVFYQPAQAQLTISGQVRTRTELRDGQGTLSVADTIPAFFTSQRTRLNASFAAHRLKLYTSLQDVRVWGQDASTINRTTLDANDGFLVHEAWAEISLVDTGKVVKNFALKIGRQELLYDDSRLLGNLDWLQQARRHDAAVVKFDHKGWTAHLGGAFNQNAERKSNTIYNGVPNGYASGTAGIGSLYKYLQFLYVNRKLHFGNISFLAVKDDFSRFRFDAADVNKTSPIYERGVWSRHTTGLNFFGTAKRKFAVAASAFYQGGKYRDGTELKEYFLSASFLYSAGRKWSVGPGIDLTSGNNGADPSKGSKRFDPLYGTPHKFWGLMDYFYVADGFGTSGLTNTYLRVKYKAKDNLTLSLDAHLFTLPNAVLNESNVAMDKKLGQEFDLIFNYTMTKMITMEGGYCAFFGSDTLSSAKVKNVKNADRSANWAYVMVSIKPEIFIKN
jgi:hypothetical protein